MKKLPFLVILGLIGFTILTRLVHITDLPQFNALLASAAFMGFVIKDTKWAVLSALFMMIVSDMIFGSYGVLATMMNYLAVVSIVIMTSRMGKYNIKNTAISSILGPVLFYLISNLGVFLFSQPQLYPHTFDGLMKCYYMAEPFARGTFPSTILYSGIFYGIYHLLYADQKTQAKMTS